MLKVVHIIGSLGRGGAERILENIVENQAEIIRHVVVSLSCNDQGAQDLRELGVEVFEVGLRQPEETGSLIIRCGRFAGGIVKVVRILRKENPDVLHTWMYHADLIGGVLGKVFGIPVIWGIFLANLDRNYYKTSTNIVIAIAAKASVYLPTKIISCTAVGASVHARLGYPNQKIDIIPVGINTQQFEHFPNSEQHQSWRQGDTHDMGRLRNHYFLTIRRQQIDLSPQS